MGSARSSRSAGCCRAPPPLVNIGRYQHIIAASVAQYRPAGAQSSVTLRLLPLPNFELADFFVEEEPEFEGPNRFFAQPVLSPTLV